MCNQTIEQELNNIFSRRVAQSVRDALDNQMLVDSADDLNSLRVPATLCTDLRHAAPKAVLRFEAWLNKHGAALIR